MTGTGCPRVGTEGPRGHRETGRGTLAALSDRLRVGGSYRVAVVVVGGIHPFLGQTRPVGGAIKRDAGLVAKRVFCRIQIVGRIVWFAVCVV